MSVRTFEAADIIAKLLAGYPRYNLSVAYLVFNNTSASGLTPAQSDTVATLTGASGMDVLRVQVLPSPLISASGGNYDSNRVVFTIVGTGSEGLGGLPFDSSSVVTNVGIAASPDDDPDTDLLYAHASVGPLPVSGSGHVGATYQITIE